MKKPLTLLTACSISIAALSPIIASADDEIKVYLDGTQLQFEVQPCIIEGTTFVPMRKIFESLGANVVWDGDYQTVYAFYPGGSISLPIGSFNIDRNTVEQIIATPAFISDGTTLVPLRIISEYMGCDVQWDGDTRSIYINSTNAIQMVEWNDKYYYVGQVENGRAKGYGALYKISDNSTAAIGLFYDEYITNGTRYYDNGDFYFGSFKNGLIHEGTYYTETTAYTGDFSNGFNGTFEVLNLITGNTSTVDLIDGVEKGVVYLNEMEKQLADIQNEISETNSKLLEISQARSDFASQSMFDTEYAKQIKKEIYKSYGISEIFSYENIGTGTGSNGGNVDSYAAANSRRQYEASKSSADSLIAELVLKAYQAQADEYDKLYQYYQDRLDALNNQYLTTYYTYLNMKTAY